MSWRPRDPPAENQSDRLKNTGCTSLTSKSLLHLVSRSPHLSTVNFCGLFSVVAETIISLGSTATRLSSLDISRCPNLDATSLLSFRARHHATFDHPGLEVLRAAKVNMSDFVLVSIAHRFPHLRVLDVGYNPELTDSAFHEIVTCDQTFECPKITLRAIDVGSWALNPFGDNYKRLLSWRHLIISGCLGISDRGMDYLSHAVPELEFLEAARIGRTLRSMGFAKLFQTTPRIRRIDLEDATMMTDELLRALTPSHLLPLSSKRPLLPGTLLEHLVLSSCSNFTDPAISALVQSCPNLIHLQADSTAIGEVTTRKFIDSGRNRGSDNAVLSILDNRAISSRLTRDIGTRIRPRMGKRGFLFAPFGYHDDEQVSELRECDSRQMVVRSFDTSLFLDQAEREKQWKKGRRLSRPEGGRSTSCLIS